MSDERSEDLAIQVRGGYKTFGCGSRRVHVMKNFNMSVPRGNIYGLLGMHREQERVLYSHAF